MTAEQMLSVLLGAILSLSTLRGFSFITRRWKAERRVTRLNARRFQRREIKPTLLYLF